MTNISALPLKKSSISRSVGGSIGKLDLPQGVADLLGGADYGSLTGWFRSEIGAVYGPLVIGATAITAAAGSTAGEEEQGILAIVLAHPVDRSRLILAKGAAAAVAVAVVAYGTWIGLLAGVAVAGGGIGLAGIRERAALIGASVQIESTPGKGTTVFLRVGQH